MKKNRRFSLRSIRTNRLLIFAAMSAGTTFQVTACRDDAALFGLRWAFSSITLPINVFLRDLLLGFV